MELFLSFCNYVFWILFTGIYIASMHFYSLTYSQVARYVVLAGCVSANQSPEQLDAGSALISFYVANLDLSQVKIFIYILQ